jgi:CubicO group peptidase (beta-lactamase class C family)
MTVHGEVAPGWEAVRDTFAEGFRSRGEVGAAVAVRHQGRVVVDLWGGTADPSTGRAWGRDTPGVPFSATKGLVAACFLVLVDRGLLDLDAPIALTWPEFGRAGKQRITTRQLLNHRAGLSALDAKLTLRDVRDAKDRVHDALVAQVPTWEPDTDQGYAACSFGLYTAELFRRVAGRSLGTFLAEELAGPLRMQTALGRPDDLEPAARLLPVPPATILTRQLPAALTERSPEGRVFRRVITAPLLGLRASVSGRAFLNPSLGPARFDAVNEPDIQRIELPWMNAITTARGLATLYAALSGDGSVDGVRLVRPASLLPLHGRQTWSTRDRVMQKPMGWSQGFVKDEPHLFSRSPRAFGHPGAGGSLGWADPELGLGVGYVANAMDWRVRSPRAVALCHAAQRCAGGA